MAETLLSPGVLARENDQSQITQGPVTFGAAIIGPAAKGPVEIPTLVTSFSQYTSIFGGAITSGSNVYSYLTSISANNYFQNGGTSLLVTRVTSGSFTPATSSNISGDSSVAFVLETISEGEIMNTGTTELANGALATGSSDNVRWEIVSSNTASGTFSLLIRRGDDNNNQKVVLESYNNLSLDPFASNYISKVIGDIDYTLVNDGTDYYIQETGSFSNASRYVRVKSVNTPTPNYFDNTGTAKSNFTGSIPVVASGSFGGAVGSNIPVKAGGAKFYNNISSADTQGLIGSDYNNAIALLSNQDEYQYNVISVPGLNSANNATQITSIVNNSISRGDSIAVIDLVNYGAQINTVIGATSGFDNSYATTYWPWVQTIDPNTGEAVFVPASTMIPGIYAFTDASSEPWFAPAGITRGGLGQVIRAERKLTAGNRDALYEANINPIATFPQTGVVVFGQKTLQKRASALDRVNVRRLLIALKGFISQIADTLVFEQNTIATRNNFLSQVNPYLESVQQRQGLYAFKVVMDDTNNTPDVIDRNELLGQIFIQPTKTAEFIILDFNVLPTGATFPS
jgi:phage tail sheath protein FI